MADPSSTDRADASPGPGRRVRKCSWCLRDIEETARPDALFCSHKCRNSAWRLRSRRQTEAVIARPMRMAYADPAYPGLAKKYYSKEPTYAGEVDHAALIATLRTYDGWALSTAGDLETILAVGSLCPKGTRMGPWVKPKGVSSKTRGWHNTWETLLVFPGRELRPGKPDFLIAQPARFGGTLIGRKPQKFIVWMFDALGLLPGDTLDDMFPGTGIVGRAWAFLSRPSEAKDAPRAARADVSVEASEDTSAPGVADMSHEYLVG
jgi:hypothetical protein